MGKHQTVEVEVSVLIYPEDGHWVAQGLEYDITARGDTLQDASKNFVIKVGTEIVMSDDLEDDSPLSAIGPAPQKFWQMFEESGMWAQADSPPMRILDGLVTVPRIVPRMKIGQEAA